MDRKQVVYSLCVGDIIDTLENDFDLDFDLLTEKQQSALVASVTKGFENGLQWSEVCDAALDYFLRENELLPD